MHWSKDPEKKKEVAEKIRKAIAAKGRDWLLEKNRKISLGKMGQPSWNKGLPKELQPRFGKPVSKNQTENMRKIGLNGNARIGKVWQTGRSDWTPRLRDEDWRKIILNRDENVCTQCRKKERLVIHHRVPFTKLGSWELVNHPDNLVTLCRGCHVRAHAEKYVLEKVMK